MEGSYKRLAIAMTLNTLWMFLLMYVMIWSWEHFLLNLNFFYMALVMVAPMGLTMMLVMRKMFENKKLNYALYAGFVALGLLAFALIRIQWPMNDVQFMRSMIPHHSGAILMCERADLADPEVQRLCDEIVQSQREEIARMERLLAEQ